MRHATSQPRLVPQSLFVLVLTLAPLPSQGAKSPAPQTFEISPGCSITSSDLVGQFKSAGFFKGFTQTDITWRSTWVSSGCTFPFSVVAHFDYLDGSDTVAFSTRREIEVRENKSKPSGYVRLPMKESAAIRSVRLARIEPIRAQAQNQPAPAITAAAAPPSPPPTGPTTNSPLDIERWRRAAEKGDTAAEFSLARAYATGNGVPQDYQQTHEWLRKASDQGSAEAQYWLGVMYRDGVGVAPDQARTADLFRRAAEQGQPQAQANLGNLHYFGRGVAQDFVEAHKWLNIAGSRLEGEDRRQCVELRDKIAGLLPAAQLADAQKRATDWIGAFEKRKP